MFTSLLLSSLLGCVADGIQAPSTASVIAPASVKVAWDDAFNGLNDGIGAIIIGDFQVYDSESEGNLQGVNIEFLSNSSGTCLLPPEALQVVDYPAIPEGSSSQADCLDENGVFDATINEWCAWNYDTLSGQYYEFGSNYADSGGFCPNYVKAVTDRYGFARVYVYVDALVPSGDADEEGGSTSFQNAQITGTIGFDTDFFEIGPGENN